MRVTRNYRNIHISHHLGVGRKRVDSASAAGSPGARRSRLLCVPVKTGPCLGTPAAPEQSGGRRQMGAGRAERLTTCVRVARLSFRCQQWERRLYWAVPMLCVCLEPTPDSPGPVWTPGCGAWRIWTESGSIPHP